MAQLLHGVVPAHQIVVLVAPDEAAGGDGVPLPLPAENLLLFHVVVKILEGHRPPRRDGRVELVDGIVHALVVRLYPPVHVDLPLELPGLSLAGEALQLVDESVALPAADEPGGLHRVHQQLQLRQLELQPASFPFLNCTSSPNSRRISMSR